MLPPDAKIFDLLKLFSKDVIASIIKPIVASLRGARGGGVCSLSGSSLFRPCGRRGPWKRGWEKEEFGARGVEERERLQRPGAHGLLQRRYCLHQTDQTPLFLACVAGGFFYSFSLVVGKVRDTVARKPKTRSNQKIVEEGSWGEGSEIF